ncbi:putative flippase GtrA [Yoonia maricola]|uniref:Putative flippase GtrA n=1 Tax=Yoonia maricola TaxID=420999 RepID=A0A2M8W575_9RHOB|nr:GtrA family protein [Yoonia maricola]PJI86058.1 putative flippase GtrA [Yoonia maricola]
MSKLNQLWAFVRFLAVGGSFSLGYALVTAALISFANAPPLPTSVIVYLLCIPAAFLAQRKFAFRGHQSGRAGFLIYGVTQLGSLVMVSTITSRLVTRNFMIDTGLFLVIAGTAAVVSYLICRYVIFRPQSG